MFPLLKRWIDTGWVVAAAVEQHHVTRLRFAQACQQAVKVQRVVCCVVVGVFTHFQTRRIKYALVVRPAWIAYPDTLHRGVFARKSAATRSAPVPPGSVPYGHVCHSQLHCLYRTAAHGCSDQIQGYHQYRGSFGGFVFQQILLSFLNAGQYRSFAGFIFIYTNTRVDFAGRSSARNRSAGPESGRQERR